MTIRSRARSLLASYFGVTLSRQTYLNVAYLLLSFPLGIAYFVVLTTWFSMGFGLLFVVVGAPLLLAIPFVSNLLASFERAQARYLLRRDIAGTGPGWSNDGGLQEWVVRTIVSFDTYTNIGYLFVKFFLGVASFVVVTVFGSLSLALAFTPLYYDNPGVSVQVLVLSVGARVPAVHAFGMTVFEMPHLTVDPQLVAVTTPAEALLTSAIGILLLVGSLHLFNAAARVSGWVADALLRTRSLPELL